MTRFLSFGLGLDVTAVEADPSLVSMASKFDGQLLSTLAKESRKVLNYYIMFCLGVNKGEKYSVTKLTFHFFRPALLTQHLILYLGM